jgi:hypothetical protein
VRKAGFFIVVMIAGCSAALDVPSAADSACSQHVDQFDCDRDPSCYSLFVSDGRCPGGVQPCANFHFGSCMAGPPSCVPANELVCGSLMCAYPFQNVYASGTTCEGGCALARACPSN